MKSKQLKELHKVLAEIKVEASVPYTALDQVIIDQEEGISQEESIAFQLIDAETRISIIKSKLESILNNK